MSGETLPLWRVFFYSVPSDGGRFSVSLFWCLMTLRSAKVQPNVNGWWPVLLKSRILLVDAEFVASALHSGRLAHLKLS